MLLHNFRWVCTRWRSTIHGLRSMFIYRAMSIITRPSIRVDEHNVPLLMLPEPEDEDSLHRRFYSITKRKVVRQVELPPSPKTDDPWYNETRYLSSYGWLLSIADRGKELTLINPFTGATIKMPPIMCTCYYDDMPTYAFPYGVHAIERFILSANPSTTSDFVAALFFWTPVTQAESDNDVAFWRNGDDDWVQVIEYKYVQGCVYISFYLGEFYGLFNDGNLVKFGTGRGSHEVVIISETKHEHKFYLCSKDDHLVNQLVESGGRLLMVSQLIGHADGVTKSFRIFEVNVENGKAKEVRDLDNRSIFIGSNSSSFSVKPSYTNGCKPNCIYYTQYEPQYTLRCFSISKPRSPDFGVYNVIDGKIEHYIYSPHQKRVRTSKLNPHMWVESTGSST